MRNNPREILLNKHRQHVKAWQQKNLDTLRSLYSEDAVIFGTVPPTRFSDFKTFENTMWIIPTVNTKTKRLEENDDLP